MITKNDILDVVWESLDKHIEIEWFRAYQNQEITECKTYGTINILRISKIGEDTIDYSGDDPEFKEDIRGTREIQLSINIYGDDSLQHINYLKALSCTTLFRHDLRFLSLQKNFELTWIDDSEAINLTEAFKDDYLERYQLESTLRFVDKLSFNNYDINKDSINISQE